MHIIGLSRSMNKISENCGHKEGLFNRSCPNPGRREKIKLIKFLSICCKIFKVSLTILGGYTLKG